MTFYGNCVSYQVNTIEPFEREAKRLARKYPSLARELSQLVADLKSAPITGTAIGQKCYKIRLKIASKGKGSSGGARVITCVVAVAEAVYLLSIYDKSEQENISDKRLGELLELLPPPERL